MAVFNVDLFLRTLVMEVVTGNWDGIANGNNMYFYQDPATGLWNYLRHDYDGVYNECVARYFSEREIEIEFEFSERV